MKDVVVAIASLYLAMFIIVSAIEGIADGIRDQCTYESYASKYNPVYYMFCEYTKPRFKE